MKHIKDLTEQDCIHCRTQEEFNEVLKMHNPQGLKPIDWTAHKENTTIVVSSGKIATWSHAFKSMQLTIHPASDFLTPTVSVLTEVGDCKVIRNGSDVIVMTGNVVITLTPPVLKHIQELLKQNI